MIAISGTVQYRVALVLHPNIQMLREQHYHSELFSTTPHHVRDCNPTLDAVHLFSPGKRQVATCAVVLLCHFLPTYQVLTHFKTLMHVRLNFSTCLFFFIFATGLLAAIFDI